VDGHERRHGPTCDAFNLATVAKKGNTANRIKASFPPFCLTPRRFRTTVGSDAALNPCEEGGLQVHEEPVDTVNNLIRRRDVYRSPREPGLSNSSTDGTVTRAQGAAAGRGQPTPEQLDIQQASKEDRQQMLNQLQIALLRPPLNAVNLAPNYDEAKANPYPKLPDPLIMKNGKRVTTATMWRDQRRPENCGSLRSRNIRTPAQIRPNGEMGTYQYR
jgi:hypothetical protein